jgi:hypothetical protein
MNALEFFFKTGVKIVELEDMELAKNLENYGRLKMEIQAVTLLAT